MGVSQLSLSAQAKPLAKATPMLSPAKRRIAKYALTGALLFALYGAMMPRDYLAVSTLLVTPRGGQAEVNQALILGQKRLILADNLLHDVIARENLLTDKAFGLKPDTLYMSLYQAIMQLKPMNAQERAKLALQAAITLTQKDNFNLEVGVTNADPAKAMRLTNRLTQSYLEGQFGIGQGNNRAYAARVAARLEELTQSLRAAEENLFKLKATQRVGESESEVTFISNQLALARGKAAELRERVDKFLKFQRTGGDVIVMIQALNAPSLETMRVQTLELMRQEGELSQTLLPKHPQLLALQKQINESKTALSNEINRVGNGLRADLETAQTNEKALSAKLETLRQSTSSLSPHVQALRDAEREVETQKTLYTSLLLRANENREMAEPLQISLIAEASLPTARQGLPLSLWAGLGLALGGLFGWLSQLKALPIFLRRKPETLPRATLEGVKAVILHADGISQKQAQKAFALAQEAVARGENMLLIEADRAMPLSQLLLAAPQAGLAEWVRGEKNLDEVVVYDTNSGLSFLPYGLQELRGALTPSQVSRLKLFSHHLILVGEEGATLDFAPLNPSVALLQDKGQKSKLSKEKLHASGAQLLGVVFA